MRKLCAVMVFLFLAVSFFSEAAFAATGSTVIPKPKPRPNQNQTPNKKDNVDARFQALIEQYPDLAPSLSSSSSDVKWVTPTGKGIEADIEKTIEYGAVQTGDGEELTPEELREIQKAQHWLDIQEDLTLREIDERALDLVREFAKATNAITPIQGQNGAITYVYGNLIPKVVCRPNRVTDIALQPGEKVNAVHAGDTVRWQISPAKSGAGAFEVVHVIIKPLMPDISTNLLVMTDRRTYNLDLVASDKNYIPALRFSYPQDTLSDWNTFIAANRAQREKDVTLEPSYTMSAEDLFFGYKIVNKKKVPWKPIRVFDDGTKTYIQMPKKYRSLEAPVLLFYEGKRQKLVNYRIKGELYIVDRIMSRKAVMVAGNAQVVIVREKVR